ncbi:MAG: 50S ribosomal protein L4 [bacterium]
MSVRILSKDLNEKVEGFTSLKDYVVRSSLLTQVIQCELSNLRAGNAHTKIRSEVSGGGKKPWKQKGTGRARHGSTRSPIWVGGGVSHGPRSNRNWHKKINRTSRIAALKSIVKDRLTDEAVLQLDPKFNLLKTKDTDSLLQTANDKLNSKNKDFVLIYTTEDKPKTLGFLNTGVDFLNVKSLKIYKLAKSKFLLFTPAAKEVLEKRLSDK